VTGRRSPPSTAATFRPSRDHEAAGKHRPGLRAPDVEFGFTATGRHAFEGLTKAVARRGSLLSSPGQSLNQHFAIVLDNKLITVPAVDYKQYPDGINGNDGAAIGGNFTTQSARDLAILLHYGALPVVLKATG